MRHIILVVLMCIATISYGQDTLLDMKANENLVKVLEILPTEIKYKKWDNMDGPIYSINRNEVFRIKYKNGTSEVINKPGTTTPAASTATAPSGTAAPSAGTGATVAEALYNSTAEYAAAYYATGEGTQSLLLEKQACRTEYVPSFGWVPPTFFWHVPGISSTVRFKVGQVPQVLVKLMEQYLSPSKVKLVRFTTTDRKSGQALPNRRVSVMVNASVDNGWSYADNNLGEFYFHSPPDFILTSSMVPRHTSVYEIMPLNSLAPGEYGIAVGNNFFCFGID